MSPINLADLPSNQPAPTGLCQIKRGAGSSIGLNNQYGQGTPLTDGTSPMQISITPQRPGWWVVRAETIWNQVDALWMYFTWYVGLSPADADGFSQAWNHTCQHSAQSWQESCIDVVFRLNAGVAYTAGMFWGYSQGYNQQYFAGVDYHFIMGEFVGEGAI